MTWVIGVPGFLSRGVMIGDVRITLQFPDGRESEIDGVQKIYRVAPNIALGFAGNVGTGLKTVSDFAVYMQNSVPDGHMTFEPSRAIMKWARRARYHWSQTLTPQEREGGCSLIFMAALPPTGPIASTVAYAMHAPDFQPILIPPLTAHSIGSGSQVQQYRSELEQIATNYPEIAQFETMHWDAVGGAGMAVAMSVNDAIEKHAVKGISPHLHICSVRYGVVEIGTNDRQALTPGIESRIMPRVVRSWAEWQTWKRDHGVADALGLARLSD